MRTIIRNKKSLKLAILSSLFLPFALLPFSAANAACSAGNILVNGSFELPALSDGSTSGLGTGWSGLGQHENPGGTPSYIVDGDHYGYVGNGSGTASGEMYQDVAVNPGDTVDLTYYAAIHDTVNNSGSVEIQYLNASMSPLGSAAVDNSLYGFDSNSMTGKPLV